MSRLLGRGALSSAPLAAAVAAGSLGAPDEALPLIQATTVPVASAAADALRHAPPVSVEQEVENIAHFRRRFEGLMASLTQVKAMVVFVDDLDRCLPPTVVDTFEAIRLFLNVPKTAYVVAANERTVRTSIDNLYPSAKRERRP